MSRRNRYYEGPISGHFDGMRFFNPDHPDTDRSFRDVLRWRLHERSALWPKAVPTRQVVPEAEVDGLRVTMIGHATALIQTAGLNILTDPVWSERASPVGFAGPRRLERPGIDFTDLPRIDAILLSQILPFWRSGSVLKAFDPTRPNCSALIGALEGKQQCAVDSANQQRPEPTLSRYPLGFCRVPPSLAPLPQMRTWIASRARKAASTATSTSPSAMAVSSSFVAFRQVSTKRR